MGDVKRRPVRVGDVIMSAEGDVESVDKTAPPPERLTTEDVPREIRIPAPYVAAKFLESDFKSYRPATPSEREALSATKEFCRQVHSGNAPLLALVGSTGCGKSHLLYSAAKALHSAGHRVFTRPWYLLADQLRYGGPALFSPQLLEPHQLRDAIMKVPVLMIDEVRPTAGTDFDDTELAKIVCHGWDNGRAILITTNVSPLLAVVGPAIASRFTQVTLSGPDGRHA